MTEQGPEACPDCYGEPKKAPSELVEWRLRDIERAHNGTAHGCEAEMRWLIFQVRKQRQALMHILSRCQDEGATTFVAELKHIANEALGLYRSDS